MINAFIKDSDHHWISDVFTNKGGLNCMSLQINWFKRYIDFKYDGFWTKTLDNIFNVSPINRIYILNQGREYYTQLIENHKYDIIKNMIQHFQNSCGNL